MKKFIIEPAGGLGNRLLLISSAYNLARDCEIKDITLIWRNHNECGCDFEDIIEDLPIPSKVTNLRFKKERYICLIKQGRLFGFIYKLIFETVYKTYKKYIQKYNLPIYQWMPLDEQNALKSYILSNKSKKIYIEGYYPFYGDLDLSGVFFNQDIVEMAKEYKDIHGNYDAVHIRRTDNVDAIQNSPTELFYQKIEELVTDNPMKKIYLATDDAGILADLMAKYPKNILSEANKAADRRSAEGMKFALYEMLILAGADTIYASYGSTFTIIANAISNNMMVVVQSEEK